MEQLHLAPSMYLATAVEVVRRKAFSRNFLQVKVCLYGFSDFDTLLKKIVHLLVVQTPNLYRLTY
jgi:hypothetical protein